jgi:hypothetical protein
VSTAQPAMVDVVDIGRTRRVRVMRVCGVLVTVVFLAGVVAVAAFSPAHSWTPAEQLARIRQSVTESRTAHFAGTSTWTSGSAKGELGDHFEHTSRAVGVLSLPDRSHWTEDYGDGAFESIVGPEGLFEREADTMGGLAFERWKQYPPMTAAPIAPPVDPTAGAGATAGSDITVSEAGGVLSAMGAPSEFTEFLNHMTGLTRIDTHTIRGSLDLASIPDLPKDAGPLPSVTITLTSDTNGRLERLVADVSGTSSDESPDGSNTEQHYTEHTEMQFTQWGAPVDLTVPSGDGVDKTPDVDEESLAAFSDAPILVPGNLPAGDQLVAGSASKAGDAGDCAEADLTYGNPSQIPANPDGTDASDIDVTITPTSCDTPPAEGAPVTVAGHPGRLVHGDVNNGEYAVTVDVVIGETHMTVESDLPEAQVLSALRTVVPFDLAKQHIAAPLPSSGSVTS